MSVSIQIDLPSCSVRFSRRAVSVKGTYPTASLDQLEVAYREAREWLVAQGAKSSETEGGGNR